MEISREENKRLCEEYPFLTPWNRWSGMRITDAGNGGYYPGNPDEIPEYDYEFTELDDMPKGWRMAFGERICAEIKDALIEDGELDSYRVNQIKEKYGELRWYDGGTRQNSRVPQIIDKYTEISRTTCVVCGKPATRITLGWISPFCDDCCINCGNGRSVAIEEYYKEDAGNGGKDSTGNGMDG